MLKLKTLGVIYNPSCAGLNLCRAPLHDYFTFPKSIISTALKTQLKHLLEWVSGRISVDDISRGVFALEGRPSSSAPFKAAKFLNTHNIFLFEWKQKVRSDINPEGTSPSAGRSLSLPSHNAMHHHSIKWRMAQVHSGGIEQGFAYTYAYSVVYMVCKKGFATTPLSNQRHQKNARTKSISRVRHLEEI